MMYPIHIYTYLKNLYLEIFLKDISKFVLLWVVLAFLPFLANIIVDFISIRFINLDSSLLEILILFLLPAFAAAFAAFLFVSIWVAFKSDVELHTKLILIVLAYLLIWIAFGNLFYFFACIDSLSQIKDLLLLRLPIFDTKNIIDTLPANTLSSLKPFWNIVVSNNQVIELSTSNRFDNYFDCLYFSGVNILTIGFGDIVPLSKFVKAMVLLEAFLGMIINVLAVGMWLSTISKK